LEPLLATLRNLRRPYRDLVELAVSNNVTHEGQRDILLFSGVQRFRLFEQPKNVPFGVNLISALKIASGSHLLLMGDDDLISTTGVEHLVDFLKETPRRAYLLALSPGDSQPRGFVKERYLYMRSGSMMGLCFPNDEELIRKLDQRVTEQPTLLYPQVLLAISYSRKYGPAENLDSIQVACGLGAPSISDRFFDHMGRPLNFGIDERLRHADELTKSWPFGAIRRTLWRISLLKWANGIYVGLIHEGNSELGEIFASQVSQSMDRLSPERFYWSQFLRVKHEKPADA